MRLPVPAKPIVARPGVSPDPGTSSATAPRGRQAAAGAHRARSSRGPGLAQGPRRRRRRAGPGSPEPAKWRGPRAWVWPWRPDQAAPAAPRPRFAAAAQYRPGAEPVSAPLAGPGGRSPGLAAWLPRRRGRRRRRARRLRARPARSRSTAAPGDPVAAVVARVRRAGPRERRGRPTPPRARAGRSPPGVPRAARRVAGAAGWGRRSRPGGRRAGTQARARPARQAGEAEGRRPAGSGAEFPTDWAGHRD